MAPARVPPMQRLTGWQLQQRLENVAAAVALGDGPDIDILFISDPTNGDQFHATTVQERTQVTIPPTAEGHEVASADDLLLNLDFGAYDENNPATFSWPSYT